MNELPGEPDLPAPHSAKPVHLPSAHRWAIIRAMNDDLIGRQFGNYRIDAVIGDGGMGAVYRATDTTLDRPVAVKVMHGDLAGDPLFQQRFLQEARAAARLDHPSIVRVYQFGQGDDLIYMVMELVNGVSLGAYIRQLAQHHQVVRLEETLTLIAQVADALGYAHRQGVIHRDIKPDNILVKRLDRPDRPGESPLRAMVTDFGLAKLMETDLDTLVGQMMGTLLYMSPEQALDLPVDGRSDLYSLGVVLYQLATGKVPLIIQTPEEALEAHQYASIPMPSEVHPGVPAEIERIIMKALARRPEDRYQTGEAMAVDLRRAVGGVSEQEAIAFAADPDSTIVTMVTEFPTPVRRVTWDMRPTVIENSGYCRVLIQNGSPSTQTLTATVEDPQQKLQADAGRKQITLATGQQGVVDFYLQAARVPLAGRRRQIPFTMRVALLNDPAQSAPGLDGTVEVRPQIPLWLAVALPILLLSVCGLMTWVVSSLSLLDSLRGIIGL
ncbi:MAG: serine/threonine-protein kinase [Chloroflexota bacterium]